LIPPEDVAAVLKGSAPEPGESGRWVAVDIARTIENVFIAPDAPDWFLHLVQQVTARYEHGAVPVVRSELAQAPFY
jgi:hypothetical protein